MNWKSLIFPAKNLENMGYYGQNMIIICTLIKGRVSGGHLVKTSMPAFKTFIHRKFRPYDFTENFQPPIWNQWTKFHPIRGSNPWSVRGCPLCEHPNEGRLSGLCHDVDVDPEEMKKSDSKDKYKLVHCERETIVLEPSKNFTFKGPVSKKKSCNKMRANGYDPNPVKFVQR